MLRRISVGLALVWSMLPLWAGTASAQAATPVQAQDAGTLGTILADSGGMTLYIFKKDTAGQSTCFDACATTWPPATAASATLPARTAGTLSLVARPDGSQQLAYNNAPLYRFSGDKAPGDTNGQGIGGIWFVANVAAPAVTAPTGAVAGCQFVLGFQTIHDMDSTDIGDCMENQAFVANGDAQQHTTKGLLVWRKADNWTAFTNGYMTWINGPDGLVSRLNADRFPWEAAAPAAPAPAPVSAAPAPVAAAPAAAPAVAARPPAYSY